MDSLHGQASVAPTNEEPSPFGGCLNSPNDECAWENEILANWDPRKQCSSDVIVYIKGAVIIWWLAIICKRNLRIQSKMRQKPKGSNENHPRGKHVVRGMLKETRTVYI